MKNSHTTILADQVFEKLENDIIHGVDPRGEIPAELKLVGHRGILVALQAGAPEKVKEVMNFNISKVKKYLLEEL